MVTNLKRVDLGRGVSGYAFDFVPSGKGGAEKKAAEKDDFAAQYEQFTRRAKEIADDLRTKDH